MAQHKKTRRRRKKITGKQLGTIFALCVALLLGGVEYAQQKGLLPSELPAQSTPASQSAAAEPDATEPGAEPDAEPVVLPGETTDPAATQIHAIDVGQGDATLIRQGDKWCLIDAGTAASADTLVAYLQQQGVERLDYVVMTHAHADHIGGMPKVLQNFPVGCFILPDFSMAKTPTTAVFTRTLEQLDAQPDCEMLTASVGAQFPLGDGTLTILFAGVPTDNQNNTSVCTLFESDGVRYLNTGDAEKECEQEMLDMGVEVSADIYKAAHHGSSSSNTAAFLKAVSPSYVLISCGQDNDYGHPHQEVLARFLNSGAQVLRTDLDGTVIFSLQNGTVSVQRKGA